MSSKKRSSSKKKTTGGPPFSQESPAAATLFSLFDQYQIDGEEGEGLNPFDQSLPYIRDIAFARDPIFRQFSNQIFYQGHRRFATKWIIQHQVTGQREAREKKFGLVTTESEKPAASTVPSSPAANRSAAKPRTPKRQRGKLLYFQSYIVIHT